MIKDATSKLQYAALPYRRGTVGAIEIMLITSRDTGRWIIPKGWPVPQLAPCDSAAHEAREEAGVVGRLRKQSIGRYRYDKRLASGATIDCTVEIFALEVEQQLPAWPEESERRTRWFTPQQAAESVQEPELSAIILNLTTLLAQGAPERASRAPARARVRNRAPESAHRARLRRRSRI